MRKHSKTQSTGGFTLVELIVAVLISAILMMTVTSVFLMSQKVYTRGENISYKEGTVTNTETNLQNLLAVATKVELASAPKTDDEESYSIGFDAEGACQGYSTTSTVDGSGNKQYSKTVTAIPHLSEIEVQAINNKTTTLNYKLIPKDNTMSTLSGGTVMNNITATNNNQPKQATLVNGTKLKDSSDDLHYLVLTFKEINRGTVVPGTSINDILKATGVNAGRWDLMIDYAAASTEGGYSLPDGAVYTDSTGTYVTAKNQYIHQDYAKNTHPTAAAHYAEYGSVPNEYFLKISSETRVITAADYETKPSWKVWKEGKAPKLGDLYLYTNGVDPPAYYIWQSNSSYDDAAKDPTNVYNWLKLVSASSQFQ